MSSSRTHSVSFNCSVKTFTCDSNSRTRSSLSASSSRNWSTCISNKSIFRLLGPALPLLAVMVFNPVTSSSTCSARPMQACSNGDPVLLGSQLDQAKKQSCISCLTNSSSFSSGSPVKRCHRTMSRILKEPSLMGSSSFRFMASSPAITLKRLLRFHNSPTNSSYTFKASTFLESLLLIVAVLLTVSVFVIPKSNSSQRLPELKRFCSGRL
mmetsp:Transcript_45111/g.97347  ORF Transcript_45111/g.97347 Transcript_45111/m.97347 type:complete len:211 (+) Transcript_45111:850-1482(+)